MFKEVAFDPSALSNIEYYYLLKREFGFDKGRYVSADLKSWVSEAVAYVKKSDLQPVKKSSIKSFLNKLLKGRPDKKVCIELKQRSKVKAKPWENWLQEQNQILPFSLVVSEKGKFNSVNIDELDDDLDAWGVPPSKSVLGTTANIVDFLMPMLVLGKSVVIVDPYFKLASNSVLLEILKILSGSQVTRVSVYSSMENPNPRMIYEQQYSHIIQDRFEFCWYLMPLKHYHDRHFITDIGAIRSGAGFSAVNLKGANADYLNFNLVSKNEAERVLRDTKNDEARGIIEQIFTNLP